MPLGCPFSKFKCPSGTSPPHVRGFFFLLPFSIRATHPPDRSPSSPVAASQMFFLLCVNPGLKVSDPAFWNILVRAFVGSHAQTTFSISNVPRSFTFFFCPPSPFVIQETLTSSVSRFLPQADVEDPITCYFCLLTPDLILVFGYYLSPLHRYGEGTCHFPGILACPGLLRVRETSAFRFFRGSGGNFFFPPLCGFHTFPTSCRRSLAPPTTCCFSHRRGVHFAPCVSFFPFFSVLSLSIRSPQKP